jgi:maltose alpha-D-glucosyltransferase/alpha-amylase
MSGFFIKGWLDTVQNSLLVPHQPADQEMMLQVYLLHRAIRDLNEELQNRPDYAVVPLHLINELMK